MAKTAQKSLSDTRILNIRSKLLLLGLLFLLSFCSKKDWHTEIKERLEKLKNAIEEKDLGGVIRVVTENFKGSEGLNRKNLKALLLYHYLNNRTISVHYRVTSMEKRGPSRVHTVLYAYLVESGRRNVYRAELFWIKDRDWKVFELRYKPVIDNILSPFGIKNEETKEKDK